MRFVVTIDMHDAYVIAGWDGDTDAVWSTLLDRLRAVHSPDPDPGYAPLVELIAVSVSPVEALERLDDPS